MRRDTLTVYLQNTDGQIAANASNKEALKGWFETLSLLIKIFVDMSFHDVPPIFEENLPSLCELLHKYLSYTNPLLDTDDDEVSILDTVKADICEALELYTIKYDEDFSKYCGPFITNVWGLLSNIGPETRYDNIVSKALHFLTAVASTREHSNNFNNEETLSQIVEKVILPNATLRDSDIELFEDEPIEFIRRDLEGSDTDSRRRSATDFLRKLQEKFESLVTTVVSKYINHYLAQGKADWKAKDTAIYLFISVAAKGSVTSAQGVKTVNPLVNVVEFFQQHIAADLMADEGVEPIAKVDAIKYLHTFRSQLSKDQWRDAFPHLVKNIGSSNYVIYTYAAIAVERLLFLTDDNGVQVFTRSDVESFANELLERLFVLIEKESSPAKLQENEFLMRCVMRILIVIKDGAAGFLDGVLQHLIAITNIMKQNPSNPRFYYYHFEALGALVRYCSASKADVLNAKLWEPIQLIFTEDVTEFMQYVLQVLAQLLESSPADSISANFGALLDPILNPPMWEVRGNVPALSRLLAALIPRASKDLLGDEKIKQILGIFQMLLASRKSELYAFDLLEAVILSLQG